MAVDNTPIIIIGLQYMYAWLISIDIPNWMTLAIEVPFAVIITAIVYRLQSKTSNSIEKVTKNISEAVQKIDTIIGAKK